MTRGIKARHRARYRTDRERERERAESVLKSETERFDCWRHDILECQRDGETSRLPHPGAARTDDLKSRSFNGHGAFSVAGSTESLARDFKSLNFTPALVFQGKS